VDDLTGRAVAGWAGSMAHAADREGQLYDALQDAARVLKRLRALHPEQVDELCEEYGLMIAWDQVL
jgi:hypothetical protein